tara:strand:- start:89 stop:325 length:237 start_codon:yes stop_codon:yes gene_type:complete
MQIKIEKNIPYPVRRECKYDFLSDMEIGDSFVMEDTPRNRASLYVASKIRNLKISIRRYHQQQKPNHSEDEMRVWRVK